MYFYRLPPQPLRSFNSINLVKLDDYLALMLLGAVNGHRLSVDINL
ncbi:hypothetical protein ES703_73390 [subsurface metagenome]